MYEIRLGASFESWKLFWLRRRHPRFREIAKQVFERDLYTCQFCSFSAQGLDFEVLNLDGNYRHNKFGNLATACPLCAQCFFLESIGTGAFGGGVLINLPELSQAELNAICHESFLAIAEKNSKASAGENVLRDFKFRSADIEKIFGDGMSDPAKFGSLLLGAMLSPDQKEKLLGPVRLLPTRTRFLDFTEEAIKAFQAQASGEMLTQGEMA